MLYSSTRGNDNNLSFSDVLLNGLAKDGGLYVPKKFPLYTKKELNIFRKLDYPDLTYELTKNFISKEISDRTYKDICRKTYKEAFGKKIISMDKLNDNEYILNLFHGPTYAFKDFALQLLGNIYDYILRKKKIKLNVLGATSGDTGSAAIYGCSKSSNIKIFILFPYGKVSEIQRRQMTTFSKPNVFNIAVRGDFDDCQKLVKDFFSLNNKREKINLAAINSINWVRIMGQIVYYFWSYFKVRKNLDPLSFVVPTGNFGNVYAGFISKKMGLPIEKLVVCSNKNDILTRFFNSGKMVVKNTMKSLSPSMDIQVSSNFERLLFDFYNSGSQIKKLFLDLEKKGSFEIRKEYLNEMKDFFEFGKLSDKETIKTIQTMAKKYNIIIDPHTAVGCSVGKKKLKDSETRIYLATAHYGKFLDTVRKATERNIDYPLGLKSLIKKKEKYTLIENSICHLEKLINKNI
ncbi:MAG: threonine synthase [Pseudomonadota bacterium]|nr:threonine synthase [Pseudomonadota bacterium]